MNKIVYAGKPLCDERNGHSHKGYEIMCCTGRGEIVAADGVYAFKRGDAAVIQQATAHSCSAGSAAGTTRVILEQALLCVKGVAVISGRGAEHLCRACEQAEYYFNADMQNKNVVLDGLGALIAALITAYSGGNHFSPVVATVMDEIDKNLSDPTFSLENCLRALPLNCDYVRKLFKKETGITPHEYLVQSRMDRAKDIIRSGVGNKYSDYTVSQIAEMCGFSEPLYFSRVFKKYYGVAPSDFR